MAAQRPGATASLLPHRQTGMQSVHKHIPEQLPVTWPGPRPDQSSSPADNALWEPSPWELLHMLWVVVKETGLNSGPPLSCAALSLSACAALYSFHVKMAVQLNTACSS